MGSNENEMRYSIQKTILENFDSGKADVWGGNVTFYKHFV